MAAAVVGLVLAGAACSEGSSIEVGEGRLPDSVPLDVPIPAGAEIGATTVDRAENRTEVIIRVPWSAQELIRFYTIELVSGGFIVGRSEQGSDGWEIAFTRADLIGTVLIAGEGESARALLRLNRS